MNQLHSSHTSLLSPSQDKIKAYLNTFNSEIIENIDSELWVLGYQVKFMSDEMPEKIRKFKSIDDVIYALNVV